MTLTTCTTPEPRRVGGEQLCRLTEVRGPVGHDFPFDICCSCGFPILPVDLAGDDFRHWHASTCAPASAVPHDLSAGGGLR